ARSTRKSPPSWSFTLFATTIRPTSTPKSPPGLSVIPVFTSISFPPLPPGSIWWNASLAKSPPTSSPREAFPASEPWSPTSSAFSIITIGIPNPTAEPRTPTASLKNSTAPGRPCSKRYTILFTGRHTSYLQSAGSIQIGEYDYPLPLRNLGTLREVRRSLGAAERRFPDLVHSRQLLLHRSCAETRRRRPSHCHLRSEGIRASFERLREAPLHGDVLSEFNCSRTGAPRCP